MDERMHGGYVGKGNPPEEELLASYRYLASILESMLDAVIVANPDGTIRTVNRAALELLGYAEEEIIGQPVGTIFEEEEEEEEEEDFFRGTGLARLVREGAAQDVELTLLAKSGESIPVVFNGSVIREGDGRLAAVVGVARDIRERKRAEEEMKLIQAQLLQAQKLGALGRLAGGIAHDFNNLLTTMRGYASVLLMDTPEDDPRRQDLQRIITAADRAAGLTRQLTLFSRREAPRRQPLRLNHIAQETCGLLKETFPRTIEIELALEPKVWTIEADPSQMSQVLMNLCLNARDAMPEGGVLTLETRNVALDEECTRTHIEAQPGPYVRLSVSDTGVGMSEEVQAHLFEPFFTTKEVGKGIGLGLATVHGIVKGHDGFITVYSEVGRGSTFHVYLPATERVPEVVEVREAELPCGTETVLFVDDEEALLELGRSILEGCGYTVLVAQNGAQALKVYQERGGEISLVVLDLVMPEMDGRGYLRRLLEMDPQVRVLIATGYTVNSSARALLREGAVGLVEKPYRLQELALAVREALDAV